MSTKKKKVVNICKPELLKQISDWAFENEDKDPLADAYLSACVLVHNTGNLSIHPYDYAGPRNRRAWNIFEKYQQCRSDAFDLRDELGRIILSLLDNPLLTKEETKR